MSRSQNRSMSVWKVPAQSMSLQVVPDFTPAVDAVTLEDALAFAAAERARVLREVKKALTEVPTRGEGVMRRPVMDAADVYVALDRVKRTER